MEYEYVPLDRRLLEDHGYGPEDEDVPSLLARSRGKKLGIPLIQLVENDCSVVLGGAGSGKTRELHELARRLRKSGKHAFVIRLESLCNGPLEASFSPYDEDAAKDYRSWLSGQRDAVALLDALDEARLPEAKNTSTLSNALANLSSSVGEAGRRLKLIISSRGSEWQGSSDTTVINSTLGGWKASSETKKETPYKPCVKVFRFAELDKDDVEKIATNRGVDADLFIAATTRAKIAKLAAQPLDVQFLLDFWLAEIDAERNPEDSFSSRLRIFDEIVKSRLKAEVGQERRSNLDPINARIACEKLAAASVLSGVRDFSLNGSAIDRICVLNALATDRDRWNERDVRQLMSSGLFHPSISGRIRFAHREIQDYLAACFFDKAVERSAGSIDIIDPLLASGFDCTQIPQSTEHTLGWLAALNARCRRLVITLRPSLLIETGDPTSLSATEKSLAIKNQVSLYQNRRYRGEWFFHADIAEFATFDLSETVREELAIATSPEVRVFLLELAKLGQMKDLAQDIAQIACNDYEAFNVREEACLALVEFGDPRFADKVLNAALNALPPDPQNTISAPSWNKFQIAALTYSYPSGATIIEAITLVARLHREAENFTSIVPRSLEHFINGIVDVEIANWMQIFCRFAVGPRLEGRDWRVIVNSRYRVVLPAIGAALIRLLKQRQQFNSDVLLLDGLECVIGLDEFRDVAIHEKIFEELAGALLPHTDLKVLLIQRRLALLDNLNSAYMIAHKAIEPLQFRSYSKKWDFFSIDDIAHFCREMQRSTSDRDREIAYCCCVEIQQKLDTVEHDEAQKLIVSAVRKWGTPELKKSYNLFAPISRKLSRFKNIDRYRIQQKIRLWKRRGTEIYWRLVNFIQIIRKLNDISNGSAYNFLAWAARQSRNDLGQSVIDYIRSNYGGFVASKFASGFKIYWKKNNIPYAKRMSYSAAVGLTGLALEKQAHLLDLPDELIAIAFRYGFCNLNGFPEWLPPLVSAQPDAFQREALPILEAELSIRERSDFPSHGIGLIAYSAREIRELIAPNLLTLILKIGLPNTLSDLKLALEIISKSFEIQRDEIVPFLDNTFSRCVISFRFSEAWVILDAIFRIDSSHALVCWEKTFGHAWTTSTSSLFIDFMGRETRSFSRAEDLEFERNELARNPQSLQHLVKTAYIVWPPSKDPFHEDTYSPSIEDRATDRRTQYLNMLTEIGSHEALRCIIALADDVELSDYRDTFLLQADKLVRASARRPTMSVSESISYLNSLSKYPTSEDEFRKLTKRHIEALLARLNYSDDDESYLYRTGRATEDDLRNWLSARLREVGKEYYEVIREQEVASEKRPDLRIHARNFELGTISVEIKLADEEHWSGDVLIDKIKTQLADQYMHEDRSHTGFYLLANAAKPRRKVRDPKTGEVLRKAFAKKIGGRVVNFKELIECADVKAHDVTNGLSAGKVVEIIAIDLSEAKT